MNSRGPLPQPDSRRGLAGTNGAATEFIQEFITPPVWLRPARKSEFLELIDKQHAAGVGTRQADAEMYAEYIMLAADFRAAKKPEERQKARRVMAALEDRLVIGEYARQRVGIRGKKPQAKGKLALMLQRRNDDHGNAANTGTSGESD